MLKIIGSVILLLYYWHIVCNIVFVKFQWIAAKLVMLFYIQAEVNASNIVSHKLNHCLHMEWWGHC